MPWSARRSARCSRSADRSRRPRPAWAPHVHPGRAGAAGTRTCCSLPRIAHRSPDSMTGNRIASTTIMGLVAETPANGLAGRRRQTQKNGPVPDAAPGERGGVGELGGVGRGRSAAVGHRRQHAGRQGSGRRGAPLTGSKAACQRVGGSVRRRLCGGGRRIADRREVVGASGLLVVQGNG